MYKYGLEQILRIGALLVSRCKKLEKRKLRNRWYKLMVLSENHICQIVLESYRI